MQRLIAIAALDQTSRLSCSDLGRRGSRGRRSWGWVLPVAFVPAEALVTVGGHSGKVMADQIIGLDQVRLMSRLAALNKADMPAVEDAIRLHLALAKA